MGGTCFPSLIWGIRVTFHSAKAREHYFLDSGFLKYPPITATTRVNIQILSCTKAPEYKDLRRGWIDLRVFLKSGISSKLNWNRQWSLISVILSFYENILPMLGQWSWLLLWELNISSGGGAQGYSHTKAPWKQRKCESVWQQAFFSIPSCYSSSGVAGFSLPPTFQSRPASGPMFSPYRSLIKDRRSFGFFQKWKKWKLAEILEGKEGGLQAPRSVSHLSREKSNFCYLTLGIQSVP